MVDALARDDKARIDFLKACLAKLGLQVNQDQITVPSLSRLHLTSMHPSDTSNVIESLREIISTEEGEEYIKDENDIFHLEKPATWSMGSLVGALSPGSNKKTDHKDDAEDRILDYSAVVKRLVIHDKDHPASKETPYFNHHAYYANLKHYQTLEESVNTDFGKHLLYGEVVTSTNTMLEKYVWPRSCFIPIMLTINRNTQLLRRLPSGFTASATVQVAGRGRGNNVWVSPAGSLMFSIVVRHDISITAKAPVVFLQYLAALAIVEGIHSYDPGYQNLPIKLKWPNDICTVTPLPRSSPTH